MDLVCLYFVVYAQRRRKNVSFILVRFFLDQIWFFSSINEKSNNRWEKNAFSIEESFTKENEILFRRRSPN